MRYLFTGIGLVIFHSLCCQVLLVERSKFYPPNSSVVTAGVRVKDSSSFLAVEIVKLDTLVSEGKNFQLYHLEIGNFSDSSVCIPLSHFGKQLTKSTVLVLEYPYEEKRDYITIEDCYHDGYSHVCPSNFVIVNPNTYFEINFALDLSKPVYNNFHFDWTVVKDSFLDVDNARLVKGIGWKDAYKFNHKTVKLPK